VSALPTESDFNLRSDRESVINFDAKTADGGSYFGMAKQGLDGSQVTGPPVNLGRLGTSKGMRAEERSL